MTRREIEELIYGKPEQQRRFTQDFPILPDVWIAYAEDPDERAERPKERIELLLSPHTRSDAATLTRALRDRFKQEQSASEHYRVTHPPRAEKISSPLRILFNESVVFANFTFEELIRVALPLTDWWKSNMANATSEQTWNKNAIRQFVEAILKPIGKQKLFGGDPRLLRKLIDIVGAIECDRYKKPYIKKDGSEDTISQAQVDSFCELLEGLTTPTEKRGLLYGVSRNREANTSIWRSRMAVKADAAARVFEVDTSGICWAVLDVGIDATHKAFARRKNGKIIRPNEELDENGKPQFASRVCRTYDFLRIKELLDPTAAVPWKGTYAETLDREERDNLIADVRRNLESGRALDWDLIEPFLRIPHVAPIYDAYLQELKDSHGTHVAGIIAANWPEAKETPLERELYGICPDLELYDLRARD